MVTDDVQLEVLRRLKKAEAEHDVKILLAVESGSRAWGFESPNSDYDARFIYVHRPEWYLSVGLKEKKDVIEYPIVDDFDINGWDIRKALRLFWKSNPAFIEWIQSPIVYQETSSFKSKALAAIADVYSIESGIYHYRSMAKSNVKEHLCKDIIPLKKYFYVLRALLSVRWLETYKIPAPIEFSKLLHLIDYEQNLLDAVHLLLAKKRNSPELGLSAQIPEIQSFINAELTRLEFIAPLPAERKDLEPLLSDIFRSLLKEAW
jgi:uncharacterized protein